MTDSTSPAPLHLQNIHKFYPGVTALDGVDFAVQAGEIRALVGKNGAGKSTLIRIACGLEQPDRGKLLIQGKEVHFRGPAHARALGIEIVSQELNLVPRMNVAENISLGRWTKRGGRIDYRALRQIAVEALARLDVVIDPSLPLAELSPLSSSWSKSRKHCPGTPPFSCWMNQLPACPSPKSILCLPPCGALPVRVSPSSMCPTVSQRSAKSPARSQSFAMAGWSALPHFRRLASRTSLRRWWVGRSNW
ncbi:MAG: sugar ABC transporter ATP-binding protein [Chloroflexi bacterium]|nr:sugar ABC transporter ATP-binding protein [Chloroflexota bacterium]